MPAPRALPWRREHPWRQTQEADDLRRRASRRGLHGDRLPRAQRHRPGGRGQALRDRGRGRAARLPAEHDRAQPRHALDADDRAAAARHHQPLLRRARDRHPATDARARLHDAALHDRLRSRAGGALPAPAARQARRRRARRRPRPAAGADRALRRGRLPDRLPRPRRQLALRPARAGRQPHGRTTRDRAPARARAHPDRAHHGRAGAHQRGAAARLPGRADPGGRRAGLGADRVRQASPRPAATTPCRRCSRRTRT